MENRKNTENIEELAACREIIALDQAVLAAVLTVTGTVTLDLQAVKRCLQEKTEIRGGMTEGGILLWTDRKS